MAQAALQAANGTSCNSDLLSMGNVNIAGVGGALSGVHSMGFPNFIDDRQQQILNNMQSNQQTNLYHFQSSTTNSLNNPLLNALNSKKLDSNKNPSEQVSSFFNSDQLIKFASGSESAESKDKKFELNFDLAESNNYYDLNNADLPCLDMKINTEDLLTKNSFNSSDDVVLSLLKKTISPSDSPTHDSLSLSSDSGCRSNSFLNDEDSAITSIQSSIKVSKKSFENGKKKWKNVPFRFRNI